MMRNTTSSLCFATHGSGGCLVSTNIFRPGAAVDRDETYVCGSHASARRDQLGGGWANMEAGHRDDCHDWRIT